jgi:hypothetical protein
VVCQICRHNPDHLDTNDRGPEWDAPLQSQLPSIKRPAFNRANAPFGLTLRCFLPNAATTAGFCSGVDRRRPSHNMKTAVEMIFVGKQRFLSDSRLRGIPPYGRQMLAR